MKQSGMWLLHFLYHNLKPCSMKKIWIYILVSLAAVLIIIQFIQPKRNITKGETTDAIIFQLQIPTNVREDIANACFDCHSNNTRYPFYANFAPVSWFLDNDIKRGKRHLNFSEWGKYDKMKQLKLLNDICDELKTHEMPLKAYKWMHSSAHLNEKQIEDICNWTNSAGEEVLSKKK